MKRLLNIFGAALCAIALGAPGVRAQQQTQDQSQGQTQDQSNGQTPSQPSAPIPAYRSPLAGAADNDEDSDTQTTTPDTRSLSGVQNFSLGNANQRSYWQPHFDISSSVDSNPNESTSNSAWGTWTSLSGGLDVHRTSGNSDLTFSYLGGGMISNNGAASSGIVQEMNFADKFSFHRSSISVFDDLSYLPQSALGFGGLGGAMPSGGGPSGLGPGFTPDQSILTGRGQNLSNTVAAEADAYLTPRSSLTFVASYSLLHYFDQNLLDYNNFDFRGGYNYQMTEKDTVAVFYMFSAFRYSNYGQSIDNHSVQLSYGRRVTGRLAFQIAAGPQVVLSTVSVTGTGSAGGETGGTAGSTTQLYWSLTSNLIYQLERAQFTLAYEHGVGGGSGALAGSLSDAVTGSATRRMSRTFSSGITGGYSRNQGLAIGGATPTSQTFGYWFGGGSLSHPIGRTLGLTLSYQLQYQNSNSAFCTGVNCGTSIIEHLITFGIGWHQRPLLF